MFQKLIAAKRGGDCGKSLIPKNVKSKDLSPISLPAVLLVRRLYGGLADLTHSLSEPDHKFVSASLEAVSDGGLRRSR